MKNIVKSTALAVTIGMFSITSAEAFSFSSVFNSAKKAVKHVVENPKIIKSALDLGKKTLPGVLGVVKAVKGGDYVGAAQLGAGLAQEHGPSALGLAQEVLSK